MTQESQAAASFVVVVIGAGAFVCVYGGLETMASILSFPVLIGSAVVLVAVTAGVTAFLVNDRTKHLEGELEELKQQHEALAAVYAEVKGQLDAWENHPKRRLVQRIMRSIRQEWEGLLEGMPEKDKQEILGIFKAFAMQEIRNASDPRKNQKR
jgi:hypothetical protein